MIKHCVLKLRNTKIVLQTSLEMHVHKRDITSHWTNNWIMIISLILDELLPSEWSNMAATKD